MSLSARSSGLSRLLSKELCQRRVFQEHSGHERRSINLRHILHERRLPAGQHASIYDSRYGLYCNGNSHSNSDCFRLVWRASAEVPFGGLGCATPRSWQIRKGTIDSVCVGPDSQTSQSPTSVVPVSIPASDFDFRACHLN
jgi:hypothetical protein